MIREIECVKSSLLCNYQVITSRLACGYRLVISRKGFVNGRLAALGGNAGSHHDSRKYKVRAFAGRLKEDIRKIEWLRTGGRIYR